MPHPVEQVERPPPGALINFLFVGVHGSVELAEVPAHPARAVRARVGDAHRVLAARAGHSASPFAARAAA